MLAERFAEDNDHNDFGSGRPRGGDARRGLAAEQQGFHGIVPGL